MTCEGLHGGRDRLVGRLPVELEDEPSAALHPPARTAEKRLEERREDGGDGRRSERAVVARRVLDLFPDGDGDLIGDGDAVSDRGPLEGA